MNQLKARVKVRNNKLGQCLATTHHVSYLRKILPWIRPRGLKSSFGTAEELERVPFYHSFYVIVLLKSGGNLPTLQAVDENIKMEKYPIPYLEYRRTIYSDEDPRLNPFLRYTKSESRRSPLFFYCATDPVTKDQFRFYGEIAPCLDTLRKIRENDTYDFDEVDLQNELSAYRAKLIQDIIPSQARRVERATFEANLEVVLYDDTDEGKKSLGEVICEQLAQSQFQREQKNLMKTRTELREISVQDEELGKCAAIEYHSTYLAPKIVPNLEAHANAVAVASQFNKKAEDFYDETPFLSSCFIVVLIESCWYPKTFKQFDENITTEVVHLELSANGATSIEVHCATHPETGEKFRFMGEMPKCISTLERMRNNPDYTFWHKELSKEILAFRTKLVEEILPTQTAAFQEAIEVFLYNDLCENEKSLAEMICNFIKAKL
jgi:hypothetical protein